MWGKGEGIRESKANNSKLYITEELMSKTIASLGIIVCSFTISLFSEINQNKFENYVSSLLIVSELGSGENEFGLYAPNGEDGYFIGPNAMAIDKNQDIYILDPLNERIKIYTNSGNLINIISISQLSSLYNTKNRSEERRVGKECRSRW